MEMDHAPRSVIRLDDAHYHAGRVTVGDGRSAIDEDGERGQDERGSIAGRDVWRSRRRVAVTTLFMRNILSSFSMSEPFHSHGNRNEP